MAARNTKQKSDDVRAAIIAALLAGQRVTEVAKQFHLSKATVSRLKKTIEPGDLKQLETKRGEDFTGMIGDYLKETLITLSAQQKFFRNESWLSKQNAAEVAVLHGVSADKAFSLLEALERANETGSETPG